MPYMINGQPAPIDEEPIETDGKHYVPLEDVVQALGGSVRWDDSAKTAYATIGQWTAAVQMSNQTVDVSGTQVNLSQAPYVEGERMYVPWDFFRDAYGYKASIQDGTLDIHL